MALDVQGIITALNTGSETVVPIVPYVREVFINEDPLFSRLPHDPIGSYTYTITSYDLRQRALTLTVATTAVSAGTTSTLTLTDVSQLQQGDVIEMPNTAGTAIERVEILADPNVTANTISVLRGVEGTTPVANDTTNPGCTLIGNSRTGAEVNQTAFRSARNGMQQYVQTYQEAVQVGGLALAIQNLTLPPGYSNLMSLEQSTKMQEAVRDIEYSSMYGIGNAPGVTVGSAIDLRARQVGLLQQIKTYKSGANVKVGTTGSPISSYTRLNFIADTVKKCLQAGGNPDVILCGVDFASIAFATWTNTQQFNFDPKRTPVLGIAVDEFLVTGLGQPMRIMTSFQMNPNSAFVLTWKDLKMRRIRELFWQMRGIRGDAREGDYIGDYAIEVGHPGWHAYVGNISTFA